MKRIISKEESEKKRKRNISLISALMLVILVLGTVGYAFLYRTDDQNGSTGSNANGVRLVGSRWIVPIGSSEFSFSNPPDAVKDVPVNITSTLNDYLGSTLYLASGNNAINSEIALTLGTYANRIQRACYGSCEEDLPEKDCSENLIIWHDNSDNFVYQREKCIFIEGDMNAVDAFLFSVLGV